MAVFSGVIPTVKVSKSSLINSATNGLINNLASSALGVAVNKTLGAEAAKVLGVPTNNPNFIGSIMTPGLISTGVGALNQVVTKSIANSQALGPAGPLAAGLLNTAISYGANRLVGSLFNNNIGSPSGSLFFPGDNGSEGPKSNYGGYSYGSSKGGSDVVFTIEPAISPAQPDAISSSVGNSVSPQLSQPPAGVPNPGAPDPSKDSNSISQPPTTSRPPSKIGWSFICSPEDISWETSAQADRVPIFGANQAPVIGGVRGMRDLSMSGAIVEGFTLGKTVEDKIIALEELLTMSISKDRRYLQIPVYRITANSKVYGAGLNQGGFFVIKSIKVQEKMRDLDGKTTRAVVDVSFTQVPSYQVDKGRDIASRVATGSEGPFKKVSESVKIQVDKGLLRR